MFESIEIRKVRNGYVVTVRTEDGDEDYIFTKFIHVTKFLKEQVGE